MRQTQAIAVTLLLLLAAGCSRIPYESVCQINMEGGQGSGTLVGINGDRALVLTCRHVAEQTGNKCLITWMATGETSAGEVIDVLQGDTFNNDLALIICQRPQDIQPAEVAVFSPDNGPFTAVGYRNKELYVSIARHGTEADGLIRLSSPFVQGMSGGATFDSYGRLVGVSVGSDFTSTGVSSDGQYLSGLIAKYK